MKTNTLWKIKMIVNIIKGRPVMYRIHVDGSVILHFNDKAVVVGSTFSGEIKVL